MTFGVECRKSRTLEIKGFLKATPESEITTLLSSLGAPSDIDYSSRLARRSKIYVTYTDVDLATNMIHKLHQFQYSDGSVLSARYELGFNGEGQRYIDRSSHNTIIRKVHLTESNVPSRPLGLTYNFNSVTLNETEIPFPSGLYLSRLLSLTRTLSPSDPLLDLLTNVRHCASNKHPKEVSEAMAMVDGVERAVKRVYGLSPQQLTRCPVRVYVVGDGKVPMCCACMCLHFPSEWEYYSIDPLLEVIAEQQLGAYADRFYQFRGISQEFTIPPILPPTPPDHKTSSSSSTPLISTLSIVVACHSHAPLSEFWSRVQSPKLAVVMPCCADYSDLPGEIPIIDFDDFEVYSPKRHVSIYSS